MNGLTRPGLGTGTHYYQLIVLPKIGYKARPVKGWKNRDHLKGGTKSNYRYSDTYRGMFWPVLQPIF